MCRHLNNKEIKKNVIDILHLRLILMISYLLHNSNFDISLPPLRGPSDLINFYVTKRLIKEC